MIRDVKIILKNVVLVIGSALFPATRWASRTGVTASRRLQDRYGILLHSGGVRYRPFKGIRLERVGVSVYGLKIEIARVRLRCRCNPLRFLFGWWMRGWGQMKLLGFVGEVRLHHPTLIPIPLVISDLQWTMVSKRVKSKPVIEMSFEGRLCELSFAGGVAWKRGDVDSVQGENDTIHTALRLLPFEALHFIRSFPFSISPALADMRSEGSLSFDALFKLELGKEWGHTFKAHLSRQDFAVRSMGQLDLSYLRSPFVHTVREDGRSVKMISLIEGHADFVPLKDIAGAFIQTILRTEDRRFYSHKGFDEKFFGYAIRDNIHDRKIGRGASTITMQLARNLFLHHRKDMFRKLEEMVLAWLMEEVYVIPKDRLLEIYLNIIEWGPNVYGIKAASSFYFGKIPAALTVTESLVLSYIVPRPKYFMDALESGSPRLTEGLRKHTRKFARVLRKNGAITEEEYETRGTHVRFACHATVIDLRK